jgi:hypothetical protein
MLSNYQRTNWEIVVSLKEKKFSGNSDLFSSSSFVFVEKAGTFGIVRLAISLFSIEETSNMDGLSAAFSRTHKRAICKHLISFHDENVSSRDGSINSMP